MRLNPLQLALDAAGDLRAYEGLLNVVVTREAVVPLERRRLTRLAALVALTPICRRAS